MTSSGQHETAATVDQGWIGPDARSSWSDGQSAVAGGQAPGDDELSRIIRTHYLGLSTREEALESLWNLDPVLRAYRPAEYWLDR